MLRTASLLERRSKPALLQTPLPVDMTVLLILLTCCCPLSPRMRWMKLCKASNLMPWLHNSGEQDTWINMDTNCIALPQHKECHRMQCQEFEAPLDVVVERIWSRCCWDALGAMKKTLLHWVDDSSERRTCNIFLLLGYISYTLYELLGFLCGLFWVHNQSAKFRHQKRNPLFFYKRKKNLLRTGLEPVTFRCNKLSVISEASRIRRMR